MNFPQFDPVAFSIGPLQFRWYAFAYLAGFLIGWFYAKRLSVIRGDKTDLQPKFDNFLTWAIVGVILGGRLGYVLFYQFQQYLSNPIEIFQIWRGGMSFHGGLVGIIVAILVFCRVEKIPVLGMGDIMATVGPIGFLLGRLANFVNGELYGRVTDVPWGMVFPGGGPLPRHPSQLYEALLEGGLLLIMMAVFFSIKAIRNRPGALSGIFLMGYASCRIFAEFFREPDVQIGYLPFGITMGQALSIPMFLFGLGLLCYVIRNDKLRKRI